MMSVSACATRSPDDEAAALAEIEVGQAPDRAAIEGAGEFLKFVESSGRVGAADDRADRRAGDDVGLEARGDQRAQDADMRPTARAAAAQCHSDAHGAHSLRRAGQWRQWGV